MPGPFQRRIRLFNFLHSTAPQVARGRPRVPLSAAAFCFCYQRIDPRKHRGISAEPRTHELPLSVASSFANLVLEPWTQPHYILGSAHNAGFHTFFYSMLGTALLTRVLGECSPPQSHSSCVEVVSRSIRQNGSRKPR